MGGAVGKAQRGAEQVQIMLGVYHPHRTAQAHPTPTQAGQCARYVRCGGHGGVLDGGAAKQSPQPAPHLLSGRDAPQPAPPVIKPHARWFVGGFWTK